MNKALPPELIVYSGRTSQTGISFQKEFERVAFEDTTYTFDQIHESFSQGKLQIAALPIWNSHKGEVTISHAVSMIFQEEARIFRLWPEKIIFECLVREGVEVKKITSVSVAKQQCSKFIDENGYTDCFDPDPPRSTVDAYELFKLDPAYSAVLTAPGQNDGGFKCLSANAANPINFTTFALLASSNSETWGQDEWGEMYGKVSPVNRVYTAIQMPMNLSLSGAQESLFDSMIEDARTIEDIPKILFVASHDAGSKCRFLVESLGEFEPQESIEEYGDTSEIQVISRVGTAVEAYSARALDLIYSFGEIGSDEFIEHIGIGTDTCFYACPALGIVTHGFEPNITRPIVLQLIKKHFELLMQLDESENPTPAELLFRKHKKAFQSSGTDFVQFTRVGF